MREEHAYECEAAEHEAEEDCGARVHQEHLDAGRRESQRKRPPRMA